MKKTYLFITLLATIAIFDSCLSSNKISSEDPELVLLNAGNCFRKCKVYKLKIYESGKADFIAIKNFTPLGESAIVIPKEKFKELPELFKKEGFLKLENEYLSGAKDLQIFEITYKGKTVKFHKMKAPPELMSILEFLRSFTEKKN